MSAERARRLPHALRAFGHRDFRLFWCGQGVSLIGTWMQSVAQSWLVLELTGSAFLLGLVGSLQFSPMLVLSFVAGALADRLPKRRLILATQTALGLQALVLAVLVASGHVRYWHVALLATVYGVANTVDMPVRQAFIVELVGKNDLLNAIAVNSAMFNGARIIGPAVAGLLIGHWGMAPAFFINAVSFLAVIGALLVIQAPGLPRSRDTRRTLRAEIAEGIAYAVRTPRIAVVLMMVLVVSAFLLNYNVVVPLLARDVLHQDAHGFGLLMATLGMGAVLGAAALASLGRGRPPVPALGGAAIVLATATACLGGVHGFRAASALLLVMGFCGILFMASANTTLQLTVPDELRGRIMSLHTLAFAGATPFGALLVGSVSQAFGVARGLVVASGCALVAVLALLAWWTQRRRHRALGSPRGSNV